MLGIIPVVGNYLCGIYSQRIKLLYCIGYRYNIRKVPGLFGECYGLPAVN